MLAVIHNFGTAVPIAIKSGDVLIPGDGRETYWDDEEFIETVQLMKERKELPFLTVTIKESGTAKAKAVAIDYSMYRINELRSIASSLGIEGFFTMKKADLITKLEEQNGTA